MSELNRRDVALIALLMKQTNVGDLTDEQLADIAAEADTIAKAVSKARQALSKRTPVAHFFIPAG